MLCKCLGFAMLRSKLVLVLSAITLYATVFFYSSALSKPLQQLLDPPAQQFLDPENINTLYFQAASGNVHHQIKHKILVL